MKKANGPITKTNRLKKRAEKALVYVLNWIDDFFEPIYEDRMSDEDFNKVFNIFGGWL